MLTHIPCGGRSLEYSMGRQKGRVVYDPRPPPLTTITKFHSVVFSLTDVLDILEVFQDHLQVRPLARSSPPLSDSRLATTWRIATKERPLAISKAGTPAFAQPTF